MVKEVLDKGKLKKSKRSGEGIYSEEAGNVLKAKTPEEEYIANREAEIKEVKDKIKENEKAIKEAKKNFLVVKRKERTRKKWLKNFLLRDSLNSYRMKN